MVSAMTPLPGPTSTILPGACSIFAASSTNCSVSGRGTSARASHRNSRPWNSTVPSKCWSGTPSPRRFTNSRSGALSASPSGRSNSR